MFFFLLKLKLCCFVMRFSYCFSSLALFYFGLSIFWPIKICVYFIFPLFLTISFSLNNRLQCTFFFCVCSLHRIRFISHFVGMKLKNISTKQKNFFFRNAQVAKRSVFSSIEMQFVETFAGYYEKNELLLWKAWKIYGKKVRQINDKCINKFYLFLYLSNDKCTKKQW